MRKKQIRLYPDFSIVTLQIVASSWRTATPVSREQGAKILAESSATFQAVLGRNARSHPGSLKI